jgi:DNA-binding XRE family transcriptional regulator
MRTRQTNSLPFEVRRSIELLGGRIKTARVRRQLTQTELADACGVARRTLMNIERGMPGSALGNVYTVLWRLGLLKTIEGVADPEADEHGKILAEARQGQRVRRPQRVDNDF